MPEAPSPIVSSLPGRLRIRHPGLRRHTSHAAAAERLAVLPGVRVAEANAAVGSLLLVYDPAAVAPAVMETAVAEALADLLSAGPATQPAPEPEPPGRKPRPWRLNRRIDRMARIGMLASLGLSLAGLGMAKRVHAGAGAAFVALSLVHMAVHRRRLVQ